MADGARAASEPTSRTSAPARHSSGEQMWEGRSIGDFPRLIRAGELRRLLGAEKSLTKAEFSALRKAGIIRPIAGTRLYNLDEVRLALNPQAAIGAALDAEEQEVLREVRRWEESP